MVSFGAVVLTPTLEQTFYGQVKPISEKWLPASLVISGHSRQEHLGFEEPQGVMTRFAAWVKESNRGGRPVFVSDNLAFDWQWINYYFQAFTGENPFGWSGRRVGDLYCGLQKDCFATWKHLRKTQHTHQPVDDARGVAEALLAMHEMGLKIPGL